jgi:hypothetical protein
VALVQPQLTGADEELLFAKIAPRNGEELAKSMTCTVLVVLRPEISGELFSTDPALACGGNEREEGEPASPR